MTDDELDALTAPTFYEVIAPLRAGFSYAPGKPGCPQANNPFGHNPECRCRWDDDDAA